MAAAISFPEGIGAPDYPLTETMEDAVIRSSMEDGTVKTRPRFTRNRSTFEVTWNNMPQDEKELFEEFYKTTTKNGSKAFNWTHPASSTNYEVVFSEVPSMELKLLKYWTVSMKIQEV